MKDLTLGVQIIVKTLNLKISCCHLADYIFTSKNCTGTHAERAAGLFFLIQPIISLFSGVFLAVAVILG